MEHDIHLAGFGVRLEPLTADHAVALNALVDDELWAGMTSPRPRTAAEHARAIIAQTAAPGSFSFAVIGEDDSVRGSTSFYDFVPAQQRVEVGSTFYGRHWWGGRTNPAVKWLMFSHAFDALDVYRVGLRCDSRNTRSVGAMTRLGAIPEGVLRGHRVAADGSRGDSAYFSVLLPEWPTVRAALEGRLEQRLDGL